ncbi:High-affinity branched-chain amino acid transport system permease protein LivH [Caulifigura coniformis]|uniref:High-affinity branched-chain amino acid transport system permease protein LivH n=1 Tax=Caulifigura coniformis TaxID=2527983 RepID=A0A517SGR5_9PLAN|nr:branched-chain amino acid ABC transporter permease [Caulifigura coniformis]QDT55325.1 High-affinity branched-chain amino acid transport system permease protein LivH [Caulifigura coniformis]
MTALDSTTPLLRGPSTEPQSTGYSLLKSAGPLVAALAFAFVMYWLQTSVLDRFPAAVAMNAGIAMMLALSLSIVNGMTGQFSIGHAGFMALGGYSAGMITYYGSMLIWDSTARQGGAFGAGSFFFAAACLFGGLVAAAAGYVVGLPSLRLRGDYLAIVTLGFGEILRVLLQQTNPTLDSLDAVRNAKWSQLIPAPVGGAEGFFGLPRYTNLFWIGLFLALTVIIAYRLKVSGIGRAMIAVREDEIAAYAMGVNVTRVKVRSFIIAAGLAGVAGGLFAHQFKLEPGNAGFQLSFEYIIMTVLGGQGSITGVLTAAATLSVVQEYLRAFDEYRLIIYSLLLIVMMLLRPQGLFGNWEIWHLWSGKSRAAGGKGL